MDKVKQKFFNDYLEVIIFFVFLMTLLVIYVPSVIWQEEDMYRDESRSRMQALYNIESFHNILTGKYEQDGLKAVTLVNAVRDSVMADSTFLGDQSIKLNGEEFLVNVPRGFDVEYDTTFGQRRIEKETIVDTTVTIVMLSEDTGLEDTLYVQKRNLSDLKEDPLFLNVVSEATFERVETISYFDRSFRKEDDFISDSYTPMVRVNMLEEDLVRISMLSEDAGERKLNTFIGSFFNPGIEEDVLSGLARANIISVADYNGEKHSNPAFLDQIKIVDDFIGDNKVVFLIHEDKLSQTEKDPLFINIIDKAGTVEVISTIKRKNLDSIKKDKSFLNVVGEEVAFKAAEYDFMFLPDASQLVCPLTEEPYIIEINEEANSVRVSSPIRSYRDNRYGFFSLKTRSHGYIIDGTRSWDN